MASPLIKTFVWSSKIRLFHWLNVSCVFLLMILGLMLFFDDPLDLSKQGKILLKTIHTLVGYVFALNLLFRIVLGFIGKGFERWSQTLPFTAAFRQELAQLKQNKNTVFKGHNPIGKLMVAALFTLLSVQMVSGLMIASTDIYYPPLGNYFVQTIALDKNNLEVIKPYSKANINPQAYDEMRTLRKPFKEAHEISFYLLLILISLHIIAVIISERKEKAALVSAMIHGYKYLPKNDNNE
ncbi:MAG: cytochrome b/b6 domain-containing protein [Alteromonadaceae bacterium]|nr:cytochrome b/b6 domain-containing protein [Alteromonadaceae bacterium]